MPCTCSTVVSTVNSGTISTMPPTATVSNDPTSRKMAFFSNHSWRIRNCIVLFPRHGEAAQRCRCADTRHLGGRAGDGTSQVMPHTQPPDQEQHAADHARPKEGVAGAAGLAKRVGREAKLPQTPPHQAF